MLRKGHGTTVEPAVDYFRRTVHLFAKPFYRVYTSRVSLGNCKITIAISERNAKRLQKEIYYSTLKT